MNRRAVFQTLIVVLLSMLLAFWSQTTPGKRDVKTVREGPRYDREQPPQKEAVGTDEAVVEESEEGARSLPEEPKPIVEPVSHSGWVNDGGYEVFGEVRNVGPITARRVRAKVTLKDGSWRKLGEAEALVNKSTLGPGEKSAFKVFHKLDRPERVGSYVLLLTVER